MVIVTSRCFAMISGSRQLSVDRNECSTFKAGTAGIFPVKTNIATWASSQRCSPASLWHKRRSRSSTDPPHTQT